MAKRRRCLIDLDGVIVDFYRGLAKSQNVPYIFKKLGPCPIEDALCLPRPWYTYCDTVEFWADLPKTEEADEIINLVVEYFDREEIAVVTAPPTKYDAPAEMEAPVLLGKKLWLKKHYPWLASHFVYTCSKHFCAAPNAYLIDDHGINIDAFDAVGGTGFLLPRPWNEAHEFAHRCIPYLRGEFEAAFKEY